MIFPPSNQVYSAWHTHQRASFTHASRAACLVSGPASALGDGLSSNNLSNVVVA
jgi:hypothetical protein